MGSNAEAAFRAGIRVRWVLISAYTVCGMLAGLGGLAFLVHVGSADAQSGISTNINLYSIAAALIGGTALTGGRGGVVGSFIAALFLEVTTQAVVILGVPQVWDAAAVGVLLLAAILLDRYQTSGYSLREALAGPLAPTSACARARTRKGTVSAPPDRPRPAAARLAADTDTRWVALARSPSSSAELLYFNLGVSSFWGGGWGNGAISMLGDGENFLFTSMIALGVMFVIFAGDIDLSVGAMAGFAGGDDGRVPSRRHEHLGRVVISIVLCRADRPDPGADHHLLQARIAARDARGLVHPAERRGRLGGLRAAVRPAGQVRLAARGRHRQLDDPDPQPADLVRRSSRSSRR